jgi:hypothetical protein
MGGSMTITLKRSTAALLIGLMGLLGGLAVGQVADAVSAGPSATASYTSPLERQLEKTNKTLKAIDSKLGPNISIYNVLDELHKVKQNTYGFCKEAGSFYCQQ